MFILLSPSNLLDWQIWHYEKRLKEETRPEAKDFLRSQLFKLKNKKRCKHQKHYNYH